jgi:hypothetical protein
VATSLSVNRAWLLGLAGLCAAFWAPQAVAEESQVTGRVTSREHPLPDVLVSDGCRVTRTDRHGHYRLPVDAQSGHFVFVTTPRGYWTDKFFARITATGDRHRIDFDLEPMRQEDRFDFVFITDMHLEKPDIGVPKFRASLAEINRLEPPPALLWVQGDMCLQGAAGPAYRDGLEVATMPVRNGPGNHEMLLQADNPRGAFEELFGPTYYSFDWGPVHCIVLDGNKPMPGQEGWKAVHGAVEGRELAWLKADLAAQPRGKPSIVGVHIPVVSTYPERRQHSPEDAPYWEMTNAAELTDLFARSGVRLVLQGHMHENERITVQGVEYVESMALSGTWWEGGTGFERGVDGSPRGYRVVSVDGPRVSHRFRPSCESYVDRQGEFYGLDAAMEARTAVDFVFNCYDAPQGATARVRIDERPWQDMPTYAAPNVKQELTMPHHFRLTTDLTGLAAGEHVIEAEVTWPDGQVIHQRAPFTLTQ